MANATYEAQASQFNTDRAHPGLWTITFNNPPINMFVPATIVELGALMTDLEADPSVKVVVFQSANPDFFVAHLDVAKAAERPEALGLWRDFVLRLSSTPVVSIAKIRGTQSRCSGFISTERRHVILPAFDSRFGADSEKNFDGNSASARCKPRAAACLNTF